MLYAGMDLDSVGLYVTLTADSMQGVLYITLTADSMQRVFIC